MKGEWFSDWLHETDPPVYAHWTVAQEKDASAFFKLQYLVSVIVS